MADIVTAIEGDTSAPQEDEALAAGGPTDMTQALWEQLHTALMAHMQTISLRSLALEQRAKGFAVQERKPSNKGVLKKPAGTLDRPSPPNSVFALSQWLPGRV